MTRLCATGLVALAVVSIACADNILKERPTARASAAKAAKPTFSASGAVRGESSVCSAYRRQLRVVELRQRTESGKLQADALKARQLSLNAVIADACE
jgi:hypothetical protein